MRSWPKATLTVDEMRRATDIARGRGDANAKSAIGELALGVVIHRKWDGEFSTLDRWEPWRDAELKATALRVQLSQSLGHELIVRREDPPSLVLVLGLDRDAPVFSFLGWEFAVNMQDEKYWSTERQVFLVPHGDLKSVWDLRRPRRKSGGRRLGEGDPADDFAGQGAMPYMLDTDDGGDPKKYGRLVHSKFRLPCRRCRTFIEPTALSTWSVRTGTIHGDLAQCIGSENAPRGGKVPGRR